MKRKVYIATFMILGVLLGFLAHAILEIWYIKLLVNDFSRYGFGWSFDTWRDIHNYFTSALLALGGITGFYLGRRYWRILYVERRYGKFFKRPLKQNF
jgi:hypothetical protein